ncbi:MAG TPA: YqaE/Pmp3 family membrane protein [Chitinophagaceae bacterium]|nr:YqaE/Pmp3 family membrane protein [Chitinophagaceae bacterium]
MKKILLLAFAGSLFLHSIPLNAAIVVPPSNASSSVPGEPDTKTVKKAIAEFKGLSKKERRARMKTAIKSLKDFKAARKAGKEPSTNTLLLCILAILLPPLAVYLHEGEINNRFWLSILLWILLILPGIIYALIIILGDK